MYTAFFGLSEYPFSIAPDPRFLYMGQRHREAHAHLLYGIGGGGGFVQLTGEVGTGKTTLCRCLLEQLPKNVDVALILNPKVSPYGLLASICDELHIDYRSGFRKSLKEVVELLNELLLKKHAQGRRVVLIVDEAQNLSAEVLEQVRLLTNLETNTEKLLKIILIGQPELRKILARKGLRQLAQRITARYHLIPLSHVETDVYIRHRLAVAGRRKPLFTKFAIWRVYKRSGGVPRLINIICDRALLGAYAEGKAVVGGTIVGRAVKEVFGEDGGPRLTWSQKAVVLVVIIALATTAWVYRGTLGGGGGVDGVDDVRYFDPERKPRFTVNRYDRSKRRDGVIDGKPPDYLSTTLNRPVVVGTLDPAER